VYIYRKIPKEFFITPHIIRTTFMIDSSLFNLIYKHRLCRPLSRHFGQNIITPPSGIIGLDLLMVSSFLSSLPSLLIVYLSLSRFSIFLVSYDLYEFVERVLSQFIKFVRSYGLFKFIRIY
jgi:hypothetical protein